MRFSIRSLSVASALLWMVILVVGCGSSPGGNPNANPTTPSIVSQPADQAVTAGETATFLVVVNGTPPLTYRWRKNGTSISGATAASYTTPATSAVDNGSTFEVVVNNMAGTVTSKSAMLTVKPHTQKTYSTNFPLSENPVSEQGNWINGGTVGLDWGNVQTASGLAFGTVVSGGPPYNDSTAVLAGTWASNQMAQATVHTVNQNSAIFEEVQLRLRTTVTAHSITGYEFYFQCTTDGTRHAQIVRWNGPLNNFTYLDDATGPGLHNGDVITATAVGNTLTSYINGVPIIRSKDSTYSNGSPGIGFYNQRGTLANNSDFGLTNFSAAEIVRSSPAVPRLSMSPK